MATEDVYFMLKPFVELGEVTGRVKVQKIFYLLQRAGYSTHLAYFLHYYGPYSEDVSTFLRLATNSGLLKEERVSRGETVRFKYVPTDRARQLITAFERNRLVSEQQAGEARRFCERAKALNNRASIVLELAATMAYFRNTMDLDAEQAKDKTVQMKGKRANTARICKAMEILESQHA